MHVQTLNDHQMAILSVDWKGEILATSSYDGTIIVYRAVYTSDSGGTFLKDFEMVKVIQSQIPKSVFLAIQIETLS